MLQHLQPKADSLKSLGVPATPTKDYTKVSFEEFYAAYKSWPPTSSIFFDTETFAVSMDYPKGMVRKYITPHRGSKVVKAQDLPFIITIATVSHIDNNVYSLYLPAEYSTFAEMLGEKDFKLLCSIFEMPRQYVAHNIKFDMHMLANMGVKVGLYGIQQYLDTIETAKVVNENLGSYALRDLCEYYNIGNTAHENIIDLYKAEHKCEVYRAIPEEMIVPYADADVANCRALYDHLINLIGLDAQKRNGTGIPALDIAINREANVILPLWQMERNGMRIDTTYLEELLQDLKEKSIQQERAIFDAAGKIFNINSPKQLAEVLRDELLAAYKVVPTTKTGAVATDKTVIKKLAKVNPDGVAAKIDAFRFTSKMYNTYAVNISAKLDTTNRVHANINSSEAVTGRMSITNPALQTLPKKDTLIRRLFIPSEGRILVFFDLDQIELRLFYNYTGNTEMIKAINDGYDGHLATAAMLFGEDMDSLATRIAAEDKAAVALRSKAKTINFALIYGVGIKHLAELLDCSETEATRIKTRYFNAMPTARTFMHQVEQTIKRRGFIYNAYGRRRSLSINDSYKAVNSLIQGCAADFIKESIIRVYDYLKFNKLRTQLINVVHDEIILDMPVEETTHIPVIRELVGEHKKFDIFCTAGAEYGSTWAEKHDVSKLNTQEFTGI